MHRRAFSKALLLSAAGSAMAARRNRVAAGTPARHYPPTPSEVATAITPTDLAYPAYNPRRYGAVGDGIADDRAAWRSAVSACPAGGTVRAEPGDRYLAHTIRLTRSVTIDLGGATMISTPYPEGTSRKIFYCETPDEVRSVTIKNGRLDGAGSTRGAGARYMEPLIWLDTVREILLENLEVYGAAAAEPADNSPLSARTINAVLCRYPIESCVYRGVTVHDNWNEQLGIYNSADSICRCEVVNCHSYNGQMHPANTPIEITGGHARIRGCRFSNGNASVINLQANKSAEVSGNTLINNAAPGSQGYAINCGQDGLTGYVDNVTITDNIIRSTMQGGISVMGSNIEILNNRISHSGSVALPSGGFGIKARAVFEQASFAALLPDYPPLEHRNLRGLRIEGNTIEDTVFAEPLTGTAIHVELTDRGVASHPVWRHVVIRKNHISQPTVKGRHGLRNGIVLGFARDVLIEDNRIEDASNCAIFVDGSIDNLTIANNAFAEAPEHVQENSTILFFNIAPGTRMPLANVTIEKNSFRTHPKSGNFGVNVGAVAGASVRPTNFRILDNHGIDDINGIPASGYSYRKGN